MSSSLEWLARLAEQYEADHGEEPWMLAVTLNAEEYAHAANETIVLLGKEWGRHFGSDLRRTDHIIVLAGARYALAQAVGFYIGGWVSAQIDFRPASAVLQAG